MYKDTIKRILVNSKLTFSHDDMPYHWSLLKLNPQSFRYEYIGGITIFPQRYVLSVLHNNRNNNFLWNFHKISNLIRVKTGKFIEKTMNGHGNLYGLHRKSYIFLNICLYNF